MIRHIAISVSAIALMGGFSANAQDAVDTSGDDAEARLDTVTVTARRRSESLQDVPLTISAFSADEINRLGAQNLEDISLNTPGLNFNTNLGTLNPGREGASIRFRGIGDVEGAEITRLQPTSVFIDGVFVLNGAQSIGLVDLERIEVIKGPQSALYGRNSFAGAINYVTRDPDLEQFRGKLIAEASTFGSHDVYASVEGPIIPEKLSALLSVRSFEKGSQFTASDGGRLGEERSQSISAVLFAQPTPNWDAKLRIFYQEDDDSAPAAGFIPGRLADTCTGTSFESLDDAGNPVTLNPVQFICGQVPELSDLDFNPIDFNTQLRPAGLFNGDPDFLIDNLINSSSVPGAPELDRFGLRRDIFRIGFNSDYTFDNGMVLTALASYNDNAASVLRDLDLTPVESWYAFNARSGEDFGFDLQLASGDDSRLRWLVGANYYEQEFLTSATGGSFVANCQFPGCPLFLPTPNDGGDDVQVFGVYGSASYDVTERLTVGFEGRFQSEERSDGLADVSQTFDEFLPRVSISYAPTDSLSLYGNWSRGFLPGLANAPVINCSEATFTTPFISPITGLPSLSSECEQMREQLGTDFQEFTDSQRLEAFETGFKFAAPNGRFLLNAAAYYYDWSNQPSSNFVTVFQDADGDGVPNATINAFQVFSSGSSESWGIELDGQALILDGWTVSGSVSYNDNEFTEFLGLTTFARANGGSRNFEGNRAARFPKWSGNLSSTYTHAAFADWDWYVRGDLFFQGEVFTGSDNLATLNNFTIANLRLGLEEDNLRFEAFVDNLFQEESFRSGLSYFDVAGAPGTFDFNDLGVTVVPQDRRTFGIRATVDF